MGRGDIYHIGYETYVEFLGHNDDGIDEGLFLLAHLTLFVCVLLDLLNACLPGQL